MIFPSQMVRGELDIEDCELLGEEEEVPAWADGSESCTLSVDVNRWWVSTKRHIVRWSVTGQSMLGGFGRGPTWLPSFSHFFQRPAVPMALACQGRDSDAPEKTSQLFKGLGQGLPIAVL
jgi:hypothetical protein